MEYLLRFRAWHKPMQRMSEVLAISYERQKVKIRHLRGTTHMTVPFYDVELMQSTGIVDKNGQEIFDGDVVRIFDEKLSKIYYSDGAFCVDILNGGTPLHAFSSEQLEIIGDIYRNPELVEDLE